MTPAVRRASPPLVGQGSETDAPAGPAFGEAGGQRRGGQARRWPDHPAGRWGSSCCSTSCRETSIPRHPPPSPRTTRRGHSASRGSPSSTRARRCPGLLSAPRALRSPGNSRPEAWPCSRRCRRKQARDPARETFEGSPTSPAAIRSSSSVWPLPHPQRHPGARESPEEVEFLRQPGSASEPAAVRIKNGP